MNDKLAIEFVGGVTATFIIVKFLKNIIKASRPKIGNTYGMPSSRSAVMAFMVTFLLLNYNLKETTKYILIVLGLIAIYIKYYLKEHSFNQLLVGIILGIIIAYIVNKCF